VVLVGVVVRHWLVLGRCRDLRLGLHQVGVVRGDWLVGWLVGWLCGCL